MTALSGIEFPSNDKLTTRCPTQLILAEADSFSGTIRLQRYDKQSKAKDVDPISIAKVEDIAGHISALTKMLVDEGQLISDDTIVINVSGPEFPNLTLTDLPGIVRAVNDGEAEDIIGKVRALIDRFLNQSRTVILAVVPANVDIHNNGIKPLLLIRRDSH